MSALDANSLLIERKELFVPPLDDLAEGMECEREASLLVKVNSAVDL